MAGKNAFLQKALSANYGFGSAAPSRTAHPIHASTASHGNVDDIHESRPFPYICLSSITVRRGPSSSPQRGPGLIAPEQAIRTLEQNRSKDSTRFWYAAGFAPVKINRLHCCKKEHENGVYK